MTSELEREIERSPKITGTFTFGAATKPHPDMPHNWKVRLRYQGKQITINFYGGSMVYNPTVADVVYSLIMDTYAGEQSFEEFCSEFGYDEDSRKAYKTWQDCKRSAKSVRRLLGEDFDRFARCEH